MTRTCDVCGAPIESARADARYCSGRCRTIRWREQHQPVEHKRPRRPLPDRVFRVAHDIERKMDLLERLSNDDRFARNRAGLADNNLSCLVRTRAALDEIIAKLSQD